MNRAVIVSLLTLVLLPVAGCAGSQRVVQTGLDSDPLSPTLLPLVYQEDGAILFVGVDTRAAQYAKDPNSVFPLGIGLANRSRSSLSFSRESFVLETDSGQVYRVASVEEYVERYKRSATDERLAAPFLEKLFIKFARSPRPVVLFPAAGSGSTAVAAFDLGIADWTRFYLYFPMPDDGIHGRKFKLLVSAAGLRDPLVVVFRVR